MEREKVNLNCNASRAEIYLKAIDGFPSDIYSDKDMKFNFTVNSRAAVFSPILPDGNYCDLNIPLEGISDAKIFGNRNGLYFRKGCFAYEARTTSETATNDGFGGIEMLSNSESR